MLLPAALKNRRRPATALDVLNIIGAGIAALGSRNKESRNFHEGGDRFLSAPGDGSKLQLGTDRSGHLQLRGFVSRAGNENLLSGKSSKGRRMCAQKENDGEKRKAN
jgi:hypothetical protein